MLVEVKEVKDFFDMLLMRVRMRAHVMHNFQQKVLHLLHRTILHLKSLCF
jgi:hypothetical protein